jgi:hypothetical protein
VLGLSGKETETYEAVVDDSSDQTTTVVKITSHENGVAKGPARPLKIKDIDWHLGSALFHANLEGTHRTIQYLHSDAFG